MGLSATLYEIKKTDFDLLVDNPTKDKEEMAVRYEIFEKNFEGLTFLLTKCVSKEYRNEVQQIFYPTEFIGKAFDINDNIDDFDIDAYLNNVTINYLSPDKVVLTKNILNTISKEQIFGNYNSKELNEKGIYPENWHDDESINMAFNKQDLYRGFETLKRLFEKASVNKNYILSVIE